MQFSVRTFIEMLVVQKRPCRLLTVGFHLSTNLICLLTPAKVRSDPEACPNGRCGFSVCIPALIRRAFCKTKGNGAPSLHSESASLDLLKVAKHGRAKSPIEAGDVLKVPAKCLQSGAVKIRRQTT